VARTDLDNGFGSTIREPPMMLRPAGQVGEDPVSRLVLRWRTQLADDGGVHVIWWNDDGRTFLVETLLAGGRWCEALEKWGHALAVACRGEPTITAREGAIVAAGIAGHQGAIRAIELASRMIDPITGLPLWQQMIDRAWARVQADDGPVDLIRLLAPAGPPSGLAVLQARLRLGSILAGIEDLACCSVAADAGALCLVGARALAAPTLALLRAELPTVELREIQLAAGTDLTTFTDAMIRAGLTRS
jgi:hypothetical protein